MTVQVGIGHASRERRLTALADVLDKQERAVAAGGLGQVLLPHNLHASLADYTRELGLEETMYWTNPEQIPPAPEQPDPQMLALEAQREAVMADAKVRSERNQVDAMKVQQDGQIRAAELQLRQAELGLRQQEVAAKAEVAALQSDIKALEVDRKSAEGAAKVSIETEIKLREQELAAAEVRAKDQAAAAQREVDVLKALLQSSTTLTQEQMRIAGASEGGAEGLFVGAAIAGMAGKAATQGTERVDSVAREAQALDRLFRTPLNSLPRVIERDANGLMTSVGGRPVVRDASGRVVQVG